MLCNRVWAIDTMANLEAITQVAARLAINDKKYITVPCDRVVGRPTRHERFEKARNVTEGRVLSIVRD